MEIGERCFTNLSSLRSLSDKSLTLTSPTLPMPTNPTLSMEQRYTAAQRVMAAIHAEPGIGVRLRRVGYSESKIAEGEAILAGVTHAMAEAEEALAAQQKATDAVRKARQQLETTIRDLTQLAKVTLGEEHPWLEQAGIPRRRKYGEGTHPKDQSLDGLIEKAIRLFEAAKRADGETGGVLQQIGLGAIAIRMAEAYIGNVERARANQVAAMVVVTEKATIRATAFETLDEWMKELVAVARVALRDRPAWLTDMGITPRGRPRKKDWV